jgi:hypothetical protein
MPSLSTSNSASPWIARHRFALVAGVTAFLAAITGAVGWAYFTASVTATGSLTTQAVSVTQANFAGMGATYLPSDLTKTGSFIVTNTGSANGAATVTIAAPEAWAGGLPIRVWPASTAACTATNPPGSALSGTWAAPPSLTPTLNAGASVTYCVRTVIPDWKALTASGGSQQANPVINVSLSAAGWVATAAGASHVQQTAGMHPLTAGFFDASLSRWHTVRADANTGYCLDVTGSGGAGAAVIAYACHNDSNQRWEFVPVSGSVQSLVVIRPRHAMGTRVAYSGTNAVMQNTANTTAERWYVQDLNSNRFQLVSAVTGLCLSLPTTSVANATMVTCDSLSARLRFEREPLTFAQSGANVVLTFGGSNVPAGTLQRCNTTNGSTCASWASAAVATIPGGSTNVTFSPTSIGGATGTTTRIFRIIDGSSNVLWDGIRLSRSGNTVTAVAGIG